MGKEQKTTEEPTKKTIKINTFQVSLNLKEFVRGSVNGTSVGENCIGTSNLETVYGGPHAKMRKILDATLEKYIISNFFR